MLVEYLCFKMLEPAQVPLHSYVMFSFGRTGALAAEYPKKEHLKYVFTNICLALTEMHTWVASLSISKKFSTYFDLLRNFMRLYAENHIHRKVTLTLQHVGVRTWVGMGQKSNNTHNKKPGTRWSMKVFANPNHFMILWKHNTIVT